MLDSGYGVLTGLGGQIYLAMTGLGGLGAASAVGAGTFELNGSLVERQSSRESMEVPCCYIVIQIPFRE